MDGRLDWSMVICQWKSWWAGYCGKIATGPDEFCDKHRGYVCDGCGKVAVRDCGHMGRLVVCGKPLCETCMHDKYSDRPDGLFYFGGGHVTVEENRRKIRERCK